MPTGSIQTWAHDCRISFVWVHSSLCLEYIQIKKKKKKHGGSPTFNCLHARLLLLFYTYAKGKLQGVAGWDFFYSASTEQYSRTSWLPGLCWMCWCNINVQMGIFILAMTLRSCTRKTFILNDDFTLINPWKDSTAAHFQAVGMLFFPMMSWVNLWESVLILLL